MQSLAFHIFHHEEKNAIRTFSKIRNIDDVGMLDRGGGARLAFKTSDRLAFLHVFVVEDVGPDRLYRDASGDKILITREIHLAHCPAADSLDEQITPG